MKNLLLLCTLCFTSTIAQGFFADDNWESRKSPQLPLGTAEVLNDKKAPVEITINGSDTVSLVLNTIFGNNLIAYGGYQLYEVYKADKQEENKLSQDAMTKLKDLNISYLRIPSGNYSNVWMWDEGDPSTMFSGGVLDNYQDSLVGHPSKKYWQLNTNNMTDIAQEINARVQPCVNYSLARFINNPDRVSMAAGYAAGWVRDLKEKGINAPYWEIGNEHYGKWQAGYQIPGRPIITGEEYAKDAKIFADSMKAANPDIKVGAVIFPDEEQYDSWSASLLPHLSDNIDYLILHEYFTYDANDMNNVTVQEVLDGLQKFELDRKKIYEMVEKYTDRTPEDLPIILSEFNVRAGQKEMAMVSTAFLTRSLNEIVKCKFGLANIWNIANGYNATKGDHGVLSRKEPNVPDNTPHASFFAYYYSSRFMGDVMLGVSNDSINNGHLTTYATQFSDSALGIIIVNTDTTAQEISLHFKDLNPKDELTWYEVTADNGLDYTIDVNGVSGSLSTGGPDNYSAVAPYTAILSEDKSFTAKPWSCNFLLIPIEGKKVSSLSKEITKNKQIIIQNNRVILPAHHSFSGYEILSMQGRVLYAGTITKNHREICLPDSSQKQVGVLRLKQANAKSTVLKVTY